VPDLDFRRLDDEEAPVATEARLAAAMGRGRQLRRRRTGRMLVTAGLVLVVATGGALGVAAKFAPTQVGTSAASQPGQNGVTPTVDPSPAEPPYQSAPVTPPGTSQSDVPLYPSGAAIPESTMLTTGGLGPYGINSDVLMLSERGWIGYVGGKSCQSGYFVVPPYSQKDVELRVRNGQIQLVIIKANAKYTTPTPGVSIGVTEKQLVLAYGTRLRQVQSVDGSSHCYYAATQQSIGFWINNGRVSGMVAGSTTDVIEQIQGGMHLEC
jgi:hypothetical protein